MRSKWRHRDPRFDSDSSCTAMSAKRLGQENRVVRNSALRARLKVLFERRARSWVQREQAILPELCLADNQAGVSDVADSKSECF